MKPLRYQLYTLCISLLYIVGSLAGLSAGTPFSHAEGIVVDSVIIPLVALSGEMETGFCKDLAVSEQADLLNRQIPMILQEALESLQLFSSVSLKPEASLTASGNPEAVLPASRSTGNLSDSGLNTSKSPLSRYLFLNTFTGSECEWRDDPLAYVVTVTGSLLMVPDASEGTSSQQLLAESVLEKIDYHLIGSGLTPQLAFLDAGKTLHYYINDILYKLLSKHTDYTSIAYIGDSGIFVTFSAQDGLPGKGEHVIIVNPEGRTVAELRILEIVDAENSKKEYAAAEVVYRELPLYPGMACKKAGAPPRETALKLYSTYGTGGVDLLYSLPLAGVSIVPKIHAGMIIGWTDQDIGGSFITNSLGWGGYLGLGFARRITPELYSEKQKKPVLQGVRLEIESMIGLGLYQSAATGQPELFAGGSLQISLGKALTARAALDAGVAYQRWSLTRQPGTLLHSSLSLQSSVTFRL